MEEFSQPKTEKDLLWEQSLERCASITDSIGTEMDENIIECVVGLRVNRFPTAGSCGGHIEHIGEKEILIFPYIYIEEVNEPVYRFVGEQEITENILQKHNLSRVNDIFDAGVIENEYTLAMDNVYENGELEEYSSWFELNRQLLERVIILIEEYNSNKNYPILKLRSTFPGLRIEYVQSEETSLELKNAQEEFNLFAIYLKNKYFNQ